MFRSAWLDLKRGVTPFFFDLAQGCVFIEPSGTTFPLIFTTAFAGFLLGLQWNSLLSTLIVLTLTVLLVVFMIDGMFLPLPLSSGLADSAAWLGAR